MAADARKIAIRIAARRAAPHKAAMFALGGDDFPNDSAALAGALNRAAALPGTRDAIAQTEGDFPSLGALRLDLTGARLEGLKPLHAAPGTDAGGCFVRTVEAKAEPAWFAGVAVRLRLRAEDCVLAFCRAADGTRMARLDRCASGTLEAAVATADIEAALLRLAREAAAEHGAEVESVRLVIVAETPRRLAFEAVAAARAMFFKAALTIRGGIELDEEFNVRVGGLRCAGDGMIANLAASRLRERLAEWEGRRIPLAPLLPEGRLSEVSATSGELLTVRARFGANGRGAG